MISKREILTFFILLAVVVSILIGTNILFMYLILSIGTRPITFLATVTDTIPANYSNVKLSIDHSYGNASISMAPKDANYVLSIEVDAFRRQGANLSHVKAFLYSEILLYSEVDNETIAVVFDDSGFAAVDPAPGWNDVRFYIQENISFSLDILDGCVEGYNVKLQDLTISHLNLNYGWSETGHTASFTNVTFNVSDTLVLHSDLTAVRFELFENRYTSNLTIWEIQLRPDWRSFRTTIDLVQWENLNNNPSTLQFNINSYAQMVYVDLYLNPVFGINIAAITESGLIQLPNNLTTYTSSSYDLSETKYDFTVTSTSGDIAFNLQDF
ncbi:MAG: hypothetical protein ACFFE8_13195 [Candidatus Heimdallarchaeota archaeon]